MHTVTFVMEQPFDFYRGGGQRSNLEEKNPGSQFLLIKYAGPKCGVKKAMIC